MTLKNRNIEIKRLTSGQHSPRLPVIAQGYCSMVELTTDQSLSEYDSRVLNVTQSPLFAQLRHLHQSRTMFLLLDHFNS